MRLKMTKAGLWAMVGLVLALSLVYAKGDIAIPEPVQKIFKTSCTAVGCHQGKYPAMNMSFEPDKIIGSTINVPAKEKPDLKIINAAEPAKSYLLMKIRGDKEISGHRMPLDAPPLKDADILSLQNWINSLNRGPEAAPITPAAAEKGQKKSLKIPPSGEPGLSTSPRSR